MPISFICSLLKQRTSSFPFCFIPRITPVVQSSRMSFGELKWKKSLAFCTDSAISFSDKLNPQLLWTLLRNSFENRPRIKSIPATSGSLSTNTVSSAKSFSGKSCNESTISFEASHTSCASLKSSFILSTNASENTFFPEPVSLFSISELLKKSIVVSCFISQNVLRQSS